MKKSFISYMKTRERLLLAFAVFLLFGTLGPASLLSSGVIDPVSWTRLAVVTIASGSFAAAIVLSLERPWLFALIVPVFILVITNSSRISRAISGKDEKETVSIEAPVTITPELFREIRNTRVMTYGISAGLIAFGWTMFALVMNSEARKRGRIESEVKIAQGIQESLSPAAPMKLGWCTIYGKTQPTSEVGGDYFDYLEAGDGRVAAVIADVSGHGVGAGLIAAMTKSALYLQVASDPSPSKVMSSLNEALAQITNRKTFVTCAYLLIDPHAKTVSYATAGHPPMQMKSGETVRELSTKNLALGIKRGINFEQDSVKYNSGDSLLLYTDGITEAADSYGKPFGPRGVTSVFITTDPMKVVEELISVAAKFSGKDFKDDATVVGVVLS